MPRALLLAAALPGALFLGFRAAPSAQETGPLHGEYGLYVAAFGDTIEVRWLTTSPDSGFLRVPGSGNGHASGEVALQTGRGRAHAVSFRRPVDGPLTLRYGAVGSQEDRHETTIWPVPEREPIGIGPVDSLFVLGDVHGEFDTLMAVLENGGLIDTEGRWSGGRSHLVFLGDIVDRGPDATRTLWFIYGLEKEAEAAGGRVHVVLGNHEIMVLTNDLRYVSGKERLIAELHGMPYPRLFDVRRSVLGKWLTTKPALIRIGDVLLAHGGIGHEFAAYSLQALDDTLAAFMSEELFYRWSLPPDTVLSRIAVDSTALERRLDFFFGENSVFWHRRYVEADTLGEELRGVLDRFESDVLVVGHTAVDEIASRYDGALLAVDLQEPASAMLLLVRQSGRLQPVRYGTEGPAEPLRPD